MIITTNLQWQEITNGHVSVEASHVAHDFNLTNYDRSSILINPWLLSEVAQAKILNVTEFQRIFQWRPYMVYNLRRLVCICHHCHKYGVHYHVSWYLHNSQNTTLQCIDHNKSYIHKTGLEHKPRKEQLN